MTLFCGCGDWWPEPGDVFWYGPGDFSIYAKHRATKCISCGRRVAIGDVVGRFDRYKVPEEKIEVAIYGDDGEIPRANHYHCEECAGLFFSLEDLGYCGQPYEDQRELVREYAMMHRSSELSP